MSDEKRFENGSEEGRTYVDGQPREIKSKNEKEDHAKNPLVWVIPVMIVILIVPLLIFHLGNDDHEGEDEAATEESSDEGGEESAEGEESGEESEASSGDADAEGIARDNCASCHGEDFSGGMGPALAGTSLAEDEFHDIVRNGQGSMPAFSEDQLSDDDITALYGFFGEQ
ncbi:c-type cytochrome [Corticicoccus populi]|uniref:C-type cytochrome n=1 Tax=Corticicoccus populi TaxID=1812821 RepID=A0ABW5WR28_9STAP